MANRLPVPKELKHLIEKRDKPDRRTAKSETRANDRRKKQRRKP